MLAVYFLIYNPNIYIISKSCKKLDLVNPELKLETKALSGDISDIRDILDLSAFPFLWAKFINKQIKCLCVTKRSTQRRAEDQQ